ncbi:MAG TPA: iron export ABC transporter permease subunit FetB [Thermoguttaceae bacterium]|nr:iron export ABC transporter permease subunit FetB [Thermoguttaceae bacterium]
MRTEYLELDFPQLAIAASLIVICSVISLVLQLGLQRRLLLAALRTVVQLLLVGLVLWWIFAPERSSLFVVGMMGAMTLIAGFAAVDRTGHRYRGIRLDSIISMWASSWLITAVALFAVVQVQRGEQPWYDPQYAIPLLGMILGNTLNGISLGLNRLGEELATKRRHVETLLALGATRWEAARGPIQEAIRTGMIPIINSMMVVGLVSLPGMMTGQLLAGVPPVQAVRYQIVIMFLIAAGTSLGTFSVVLLGYRRMFTADHQFASARLTKRR